MKHTSTISLDHSEVIGNITKNSSLVRFGSEQAIQNGFAAVMKKLSDCGRVRCSYYLADGGSSNQDATTSILYTCKDKY
jgi:hypothetical protein